MRSQALEHSVLGFTVLATLIWFNVLPAAFLEQAAMVLLAWAAFSTFLVGSAGAWVAFARARARADNARSRPEQRLTTHRG